MSVSWTDEQLSVIQSQSRRLAVSASAGAGKTGVLVERYLGFVNVGIDADRILAITFTRKAAAEMKRRVVDRLRASGNEAQARLAETGPIQTIHGFCERILRENSLAAGIDPRFEIIDSGTTYRAEALRTILADPGDSQEVRELIRAYAGMRPRKGEETLGRKVHSVLERIRGTGLVPSELERDYIDASTTLRHQRIALQKAYEVVIDPMSQDWAQQMASLIPTKEARLFKRDFDDAAAALQVSGLIQLAVRVWRLMEARMIHDQRFDFTLLEQLAVDLVEQDDSVRRRVASSYAVLLVDEAQDNNPVQNGLLSKLPIEWGMIVGDVQQSIYGFRRADPDHFAAAKEAMGELRLTKNHRSAPGIQRFVDHIFLAKWPDYAPMTTEKGTFENVELWNLPAFDSEGFAELTVRFFEETSAKPGETAVLVSRHAEAGQLRKALMRRGIQARATGEYYYTRLEVRDAANALRALVDPTDDFALLALLRSPFGGLSPDGWTRVALRKPVFEAIHQDEDHSEEDRAKLAQFRDWFLPLSQIADRRSAYETLGDLFAQSPWLERLARRPEADVLIANSRKLLDLAANQPELGPAEFAEQIREIQRFDDREEHAPIHEEEDELVTLVTNHSAKGLEWNNVIVATGWSRLASNPGDVLIDVPLKLATIEDPKNLADAFLRPRKQDAEGRESWRKAYVALTRARQRLCVVVCPGKQNLGGELAKLAGLGKDFPDEQVRNLSD